MNSNQSRASSNTLLILGAKSEIAQAIAQVFARNNFDIILAARNIHEIESTKTDLEIRYQVKAFLSEFDAEQFGTHRDFYANLPVRPTVVVCAFGYLGEQSQAGKNWLMASKIINVNYVGAVSVLNLVADDFEAKREGTIIGISSVAGDRGRQSNYLYGSAKAALTVYLEGLTHRLLKSNVQVLTVKPGFIETRMLANIKTPKFLTAKPDQLAEAVYKAFVKRQHTLYYFRIWRSIMFLIRAMPNFVFYKTKL